MTKRKGQLEVLTDKEYESLPYKNIYEENGYAYAEFDNGNEKSFTIELGKIITCDGVITDIDNSETIIILNNGRTQYFLKPSNLTPDDILQLSDYGFDVTFKNKIGYYQYISDLRAIAAKKYSHHCIGWKKYKKSMIFEYHNLIFNDKIITSQYTGDFNLCERGTLKEWENGIKNLVIGKLGMELALLTAACSVVMGYVGESLQLNTFIAHFFGNSSTGKTTAEKLAISFFTAPKVGERSLFNTFNGTKNSLMSLLSLNYGVLLVLDDSSNSTINNMVDFIYSLTADMGKRRLNTSAQQIAPDTWRTVIMTSGEEPLIAKEQTKDGYKVRYVEFNMPFTISAEHALAVNQFSANNYGSAVIPFVRGIMKIGEDKIINVFNKYHSRFMEALPNGRFNDRLSKIYALYVVSASLLNTIFKLGIDKKRIFQYFCSYHSENKNAGNVCEKAYSFIKEYIDKNFSKFIIDCPHYSTKTNSNFVKECFGRISKYDDYIEVSVIRSVCDEILTENGFGNLKEIYKHFKEKEYIDTDKGLFTKRKTILIPKQPCIVFLFSKNEIPMFITHMHNNDKKLKRKAVRTLKSNNACYSDDE